VTAGIGDRGSKLRRRRLRLGAIAVAAAIACVARWSSAAGAEPVRVTIGSVLATDGGQPEFDSRLVAMKPQFDSLFRYSSYRLMKEDARALAWGQGASFEIPGGRYLVVTPKELRDSKITMSIMLLEGGRPLVDTSVALRNHGVLLLGGPKQQEGVLIISIGAEAE
jgi:hypothetical protein